MRKIDDGGSAFAHAIVSVDGNGQPLTPNEADELQLGLTIRDWFAGRAMQGQLSGFWSSETPHGWSDQEIAAEAYRIADAMIAARKGGVA